MTCSFLESGRCKLAEACARDEVQLELECRPDSATCERCQKAGPPREDRPSLPCMGLVTKQIPADRRLEWVKFTTWIHQGKSRGLGDTVAKITRATGIDRAVKAVAGKGCGCGKRQKKLNARVPYSDSQNSIESNSENLPGPSTVRAS